MKKIIIPFFALSLVNAGFSQSIDDHKLHDGRINDYSIVEDAMEVKHPGYKNYMNTWHKQIASQVNNQVTRSSRSIIEIPVVVHIVWKNPVENIPQADVDAQIAILNRDFQRNNPDTVNMRSVFQPIAGNPNIKFNLVTTIYHQTTSDFNIDFFGGTLYDAIKTPAQGGSGAWNTSNYMNIWVGNLQGEFLLGYAYPPSGAPGWPAGQAPFDPNMDGVVVDYRAFGPSSIFAGNPLQGRTSVHEVGHYLGLRHIWGDGPCSDDDNIADTPIADSASAMDCDKIKNTCNQGAGDLPDMVENYMDYASESCQNSFTAGQASFMRTVVNTYRPGLLNNPASIDEKGISSLTIYPNPTNDILYINGFSNNTNALVEVVDLQGKVVLKSLVSNNSIDVSNINDGIYILKVVSSEGQFSERLFKQ